MLSESRLRSKNEASLNSFYVFFVINLVINPRPSQFSNLQSPRTLYIISEPIIHKGLFSDPLLSEKKSVFSKLENQFADNPEILNTILKKKDNNQIESYYGKPYSTIVLKTKEDGFEAIEAYKQSIRDAVEGLPNADLIDFIQLK